MALTSAGSALAMAWSMSVVRPSLPFPNQKACRNGTLSRDPVAISSSWFSMRAVKV